MSSNHFISNDIEVPFCGPPETDTTPPSSHLTGLCGVIALSVEFVARPHEAQRLRRMIPLILTGVLQGVSGFAGCLVMVSDQEARLVTVITLWEGEDARKRSMENARSVQTLLAPLIDHQLRVQSLIAFAPALHATKPAETYAVGECPTFAALIHAKKGSLRRVNDSGARDV